MHKHFVYKPPQIIDIYKHQSWQTDIIMSVRVSVVRPSTFEGTRTDGRNIIKQADVIRCWPTICKIFVFEIFVQVFYRICSALLLSVCAAILTLIFIFTNSTCVFRPHGRKNMGTVFLLICCQG